MEVEYYKDARIEIRMDPAMKEEMEREAKRQDTNVSGLIRALFQNHVRWRDGHGLSTC